MIKYLIRLSMVFIILFLMTACRNEVVLYTESESIQTSESITSQEAICTMTTEYSQESDNTIKVHICGAVMEPGVYEIPEDSRICDAIEAAGGFHEEACRDYVNLAQTLEDGCKIVIPTETQIKKENLQDDMDETFQTVITDRVKSGSAKQSSLVNINTADEEKLKTLTGIGDTRAKSIIAYREEHGEFRSIEEIMNVSGIKEASYEKIKDEITVK